MLSVQDASVKAGRGWQAAGSDQISAFSGQCDRGAGGCAPVITPADGIECRFHRASPTRVASHRTSTPSGHLRQESRVIGPRLRRDL